MLLLLMMMMMALQAADPTYDVRYADGNEDTLPISMLRLASSAWSTHVLCCCCWWWLCTATTTARALTQSYHSSVLC